MLENIKEPLTTEQVQARLKVGAHNFTYTTKSGNERKAIGTLDPTIIEQYIGKHEPKEELPTGPKKSPVTYYDLEAQGFRVCDPSTVVFHD